MALSYNRPITSTQNVPVVNILQQGELSEGGVSAEHIIKVENGDGAADKTIVIALIMHQPLLLSSHNRHTVLEGIIDH